MKSIIIILSPGESMKDFKKSSKKPIYVEDQIEESEKVEEPKEDLEEESIEPKKFSKKELFAMKKDEQIAMLESLGSEEEIPKKEKGRVALILKLQK